MSTQDIHRDQLERAPDGDFHKPMPTVEGEPRAAADEVLREVAERTSASALEIATVATALRDNLGIDYQREVHGRFVPPEPGAFGDVGRKRPAYESSPGPDMPYVDGITNSSRASGSMVMRIGAMMVAHNGGAAAIPGKVEPEPTQKAWSVFESPSADKPPTRLRDLSPELREQVRRQYLNALPPLDVDKLRRDLSIGATSDAKMAALREHDAAIVEAALARPIERPPPTSMPGLPAQRDFTEPPLGRSVLLRVAIALGLAVGGAALIAWAVSP